MKVLILCAGRGERLKPLTDTIPKPMVPINNKPLLEYSILLCKKHGITEIAINTSYLPEKIKEYFGNGEKFGVKIRYSYEPELLGTSGALNNFKDFLDETFVVIYGDNLTDINLTEMLNYHKEKKAIATLFLFKEEIINEKTTPGWVVFDNSGRIKNLIENPTEQDRIKFENENKLTNGGVYVLEPEILNYIPEGFSDFMKNLFPELLNQSKLIYIYVENCYFRELGQMIRYLKAKQEIESAKIKLNL